MQKIFTRNFTFLILGQISSLFGNYTLKFALSMYVLEQTDQLLFLQGCCHWRCFRQFFYRRLAAFLQIVRTAVILWWHWMHYRGYLY